MDTVPPELRIQWAETLEATARWLRTSTQTNLPVRGTRKTCFHQACPQEAQYFGRCQEHAPRAGVHYCNKCWRLAKAHNNGEACEGGELQQAAPVKFYKERSQ